MKHKIPLFISLAFTGVGTALLYFNFPITAQIFLVLGVFTGIVSFKMNGCVGSAITHFLPVAILAYLYYTPGAFPFLSASMLLAGIQNPFLEIFFPGKMYNSPATRIVISILSISCYFMGVVGQHLQVNIWIFSGIVLLLVNLLTFLIVADIFKLKKISCKGYLKSGSPCPDFSLPDETGTIISSKDFKGKYLLLIFVRGDWCPGCHIMLRCYERNREKFASRGVNLLSIGPDPLGVNKEMVKKLGLHYHVLSDEKQLVAKQFCVELQEKTPGQPEYDFIPLPASFLIDKEGIVRYTSRADVAGEILNPEHIFQILDSLK